MDLPFIVETYRGALPEEQKYQAEHLVAAAVRRAREKHSDFDRFTPAVDFLSRAFFVNHALIPLDDYIESLYCAVKHGDFTKSWRAQLKRPAPSPVS